MNDSLLGQRFGRYTVIAFAGSVRAKGYRGTRRTWLCRCDCGNERVVPTCNLRTGNSKSCGCYKRERTSELSKKYVHGNTRANVAWYSMRSRCTKPKSAFYSYYGGRGIKVCDRWLNDFEQFYADMGDCPEGYSLERLDVNGDYSPENCKWIPIADQGLNKRNTVRVEYGGKSVPLIELARRFDLPARKLHRAYKELGMPIEEALDYVRKRQSSKK
jgi:hypothetical protein